MTQEVRICVCGDEGTGKSSLIASLVKDVFITNKIQSVLPQIAIPPNIGTPENVTTTIVDTSARPQDRNALRKEIRKCNVILLVYADHYSYERVALFWMPYFRSLGVNVPVVLCANKSDLAVPGSDVGGGGGSGGGSGSGSLGEGLGGGNSPGRPGSPGSPDDGTLAQVVDEEMVPVMQEFREIDSCIRTSARKHHNVNEVFFLCQKAVTHPIAPLFDYKEGDLKPACVAALRRIFYLCDKDQNGFLNDREMYAFQETVFNRSLAPEDLASIKLTLAKTARPTTATVMPSASLNLSGSHGHSHSHSQSATTATPDDRGIDLAGFLHLNLIYAEKGRHETIWVILRKFHYTDSLSLAENFLHPRFDVPEYASAELSPAGYRFFMDLFLLFDQDNDGGLNDAELAALFAPTPGLPASWVEAGFPASTVRNEAGYITLQGWLAQWSMTTFLEPKTTIEYLAYLGFEAPPGAAARDAASPTTAALKVTRPRKRRHGRPGNRGGRVDRNVVLCYVVGAPGAGKSTLLDAFLGQPFDGLHRPTIRPRRAVNSVELEGGKQVYLILEELGELEPAVLENPARLDACDLLCLAYDSSDPDSFGHLVALRESLPGSKGASPPAPSSSPLDDVPAVYAALKADRDKTTQRSAQQPDAYTAALHVSAPLHVSATWDSISELFVTLAEVATNPSLGYPKSDEPAADRTSLYVALGAVACAAAAAFMIAQTLHILPSAPSSRPASGQRARQHDNVRGQRIGPQPTAYSPHGQAPWPEAKNYSYTSHRKTKNPTMFVLPPPPRYPAQMMYGGMYPGGQMLPMIETNNILSHPAGPDCQFLVGEGLYVLEEDLLLATPPPHPSEAPVINVNPLATTPLPATAGPRLSLVSIVDPPRPRALSRLLAAGAATGPTATSFAPVEEHASENESAGGSGAPASQHTDSATTGTGRLSFHTTSASGASDTALAAGAIPIAHDAATTTTTTPFPSSLPTPLSSSLPASFSLSSFGGSTKAGGSKQRKPKNSVTKSNSSFISRVIVHDGLTKRLQERPLDGLFGFANINRAFQWLDLASEKKQDYLTKILFTKAHCLCHDINPATKSTTHIDVIMGYSTGEIIWWEPISQRYMRLNKNGIIRGTPVSEIRWLPGSENLFMAAFMDGSLVIFDKEKEDAAFAVDEEEVSRRAQQQQQDHHDARAHIQVNRSIHSRGHKANPVAFWKLSNQRINAFAFAPGQSLLAVVSEDGSLRIIDYLREELIGLFYSYYGGLTCVCWSPDDKYVVTGGQDDLLSIWNVADASLAARCQGHHSWVTSVAFDPWRCDDRNYRFGSVGEDCRLCLWDFSMGMLIRPKAAAAAAAAAAASSTRPPRQARPWSRADSALSSDWQVGIETSGTADEASDAGTQTDERVHLVEPRSRTALLPPICVVAKEPLCWLGFTEKTIMTSSKTGHIRTWKRPTDNSAQAEEEAQG